MCKSRVDPYVAAGHVLEAIKPPIESAISVGTFFRDGKPLALKVTIEPEFGHLKARVPSRIDGYEVISEVAPRAYAY